MCFLCPRSSSPHFQWQIENLPHITEAWNKEPLKGEEGVAFVLYYFVPDYLIIQLSKVKVKFILHSDGNKMNIGGKKFIVLRVHWYRNIDTQERAFKCKWYASDKFNVYAKYMFKLLIGKVMILYDLNMNQKVVQY